VAATDATVVIEGETGTGKEMLAHMIHGLSPRARQAFVAVDCAAIAASRLESELFGTARGALSGAERERGGVFEAANRGTVFLKEIGELDQRFQAHLARFLQDREARSAAAQPSNGPDVRVICSTHRDLERMVQDDEFRKGLWYRINTVHLAIPPVRERREDIPLLARFYADRYNASYQRSVDLAASGIEALQEYSWPGNVLQIQRVIEGMTILAERIDGDTVREALRGIETKSPRRPDVKH
jgi:transcriptional regulator with PAS, ATPase and Fis domain